MLIRLLVKNYALIEHLELRFDNGLSVISGETGAGKSILLGAFSLVLGQRADTQAILNADEKCIVEGEFDVSNIDVKDFFERNNFDAEKQSILRREISKDGKSRAFINDTPATLSQVKELGMLLVDIHSQHETLALNNKPFQLSVVDAFAGNRPVLARYQGLFHQYSEKQNKRKVLLEQEEKSKSELEYFNFLFEELEKAELKVGEQERLEQDIEVLSNADRIKSDLVKAADIISEGEDNVSNKLREALQTLRSTSSLYEPLIAITERIQSAAIELKDIGEELSSLQSSIESDSKKEEELQSRLSVLFSLQQKHRVKNNEELIAAMESLSGKIEGISSLSNEIAKLEIEIAELHSTLMEIAKTLSDQRKKSIPKIEKEITKMLHEVSMPGAVFQVEFLMEEKLNASGMNSLRFLFSANKGIQADEISKVASGGELSRLMLCIKSLVSKQVALPTMIFDEIDTGISGETAMRVGDMLQKISEGQQIICITHLPQIASKGKDHFYVFKDMNTKHPFTRVKKLNKEERLNEIAKMISGEKPGAAAIENAKELLKQS